jgi:alanine racemase
VPGLVRVDAVVKADAYGHGRRAVASWLVRSGVDGLCVATLDEGLDLRALGLGVPILVLYPIPPALVPTARAARLTLAIGDRVLLDRTLDAAAAGGDGPALEVQLEVETGLGRGGVAGPEVAAVRRLVEMAPGVRLTGIWSHLAAPDDAARSADQVEAFGRSLGADPPAGDRHLASTGGLVAASAPPYDRVRPGLGLYGLVPDELGAAGLAGTLGGALRPILSLKARPVRVAELPAGHGISYGPTFETARTSRIATLPLGYGDGWSRALSNRAAALVRGVRVPLVGNVAMDAVMADVTDITGPPVSVDDEFVLIGEQVAADGSIASIAVADVARARTTNSWEVVTQMAARLPRVYHSAAVPVGVTTLTEEVLAW